MVDRPVEDAPIPVEDEPTPVESEPVQVDAEVVTKRRGRQTGDTNLPAFLRAAIGATARIAGQASTARAFGISTQHAHHLAHGRLRGKDPNGPTEEVPELKSAIESNVEQARESAGRVLADSLAAITPEKLSNVSKVTELSKVAKDVASVLDRTRSKDQAGTNVNFLIYEPKERSEEDFEEPIYAPQLE